MKTLDKLVLKIEAIRNIISDADFDYYFSRKESREILDEMLQLQESYKRLTGRYYKPQSI